MAEKEYRVEKIIRTIVRGNEVFYKVKWMGYFEPTEQPETNSDIRALVDDKWIEDIPVRLNRKEADPADEEEEGFVDMGKKTWNQSAGFDPKRTKMIKKPLFEMDQRNKQRLGFGKPNVGNTGRLTKRSFDL